MYINIYLWLLFFRLCARETEKKSHEVLLKNKQYTVIIIRYQLTLYDIHIFRADKDKCDIVSVYKESIMKFAFKLTIVWADQQHQ